MKDITTIRGDSVALDVAFKDSNNTAIDLTGALVFFTVKKRVTDLDVDALIKVDIDIDQLANVDETFDPKLGVVEIAIPAEDTQGLAGVYSFDVQLKDSDGNISSYDRVKFIVNKDVTLRTE